MKRALALVLVIAAALVAGIVAVLPAQAASPGTGFGEWAPSTRYGWHGSMAVSGIHTYCIFPGRPLPTGDTEDRGISGTAAGLDARQLTAINMLVTTYGQTDDPVQAAAVGWAVKAVSNWNETLHTFGYPGDTLQGAIDWVFQHIAPEHNGAVQNLAAAYYAEAMAVTPGQTSATGALHFAIDAHSPLRGTMTARADAAGARGTVTLERAVFADTGSATREGVELGVAYEILAIAPPGEREVRVSGSGTFTGGYLPVVHHFTTPGGQDTAGPGGKLEFPLIGEDAVTRDLTFAPVITTQVVSRYVAGGAYLDDVTFAAERGVWGRTADGGYLSVAASATLYRTDAEPRLADEVPADAEAVATLEARTDPAVGPTAPYRVESAEPLPGPGFYTAVWEVSAEAQPAETAALLEPGYRWRERFGVQSQITMVPDITSRADPIVSVGAPMSDEVIVAGPVPETGLMLTAAVFRVPDGVDPVDACTPDNLIATAPGIPVRVLSAGRTRLEGPVVPDFGTYVWRERAVDAYGLLVHEGACGVESETTRAPLPTVTTIATERTGLGGAVVDVAKVSGPVPVSGTTTLTFEVFRAAEGVVPADACTPEARVADTTGAPVVVTAEGDHTSPEVRLHEPGTYFWIETLWHTPEGGEARPLARGACGLPNETTVVETPAVTTLARERAALGEPFHDTATVIGLADGVDAELVFSVHHSSAGEPPRCDETTLEHLTAPVPVTGSGEYTSPSVTSDRAGAKLWIAELRYRPAPGAEQVVLHTGGCGEAGETTYVAVLAASGAGGIPMRTLAGGGIALLALGLGCAAIVAFRRSRPRPAAAPR